MLFWVGFLVFIVLMLAVDLGLFNRKPHVIGMNEALTWFAVWIGLALLFNVGLVMIHPRGLQAGLEFLTGYLVEKSLSIDNVFVFVLIFNYFKVPPVYQHKVLSLGIIGAIVLRLIFILGGLALLSRFHWTIYLFGAFLLVTGLMMMFRQEKEFDPGKNWLILMLRRLVPVTEGYEGDRLFLFKNGRLWTTPMLIALLAIESSDILFATDSIPAIFAITSDPFIVFTSNLFAMLGLRALYFAVQDFMKMFHYLNKGFALIITVLGVKMLINDFYEVPISLSLVLIVFILLSCVIASILRPRKADLKQLFERTEQLGLIPFRRLLLIENIVDLGERTVSGSMRCKSGVHVIRLNLPWADNLKMLSETHFSRYPLVERDGAKPIGFIHVKSLGQSHPMESMTTERLVSLARPCLEMPEDLPLEEALSLFQRRYERMGVAINQTGDWTGILTFEDVVQEIIGNMGDEFDRARAGDFISLVDALTPGRIVLDLKADTMTGAVQEFIARIPPSELPNDAGVISSAVMQRKRVMPMYVGNGLAIPHGRLDGIQRPVLAFARCDEGIALENTNERADLFFLLLTPTRSARLQSRLIANIHGLFKSQYVSERLRKAQTPEAVIEAIHAGQQVALD